MMFPTHRMLMFYCIVVIIFLASHILLYLLKERIDMNTDTWILEFYPFLHSIIFCLDPIEPDGTK